MRRHVSSPSLNAKLISAIRFLKSVKKEKTLVQYLCHVVAKATIKTNARKKRRQDMDLQMRTFNIRITVKKKNTIIIKWKATRSVLNSGLIGS